MNKNPDLTKRNVKFLIIFVYDDNGVAAVDDNVIKLHQF